MNLFGKKKADNLIIRLFKITDKNAAEKFDMEDCILSVLNSLTQHSDLVATDFSINYNTSRKTINGFKKALSKQKVIVDSFVGFDSDKTNTYFSISNPMLNWSEQPKNSTIDLCIRVTPEFMEKSSLDKIAEKLIEKYQFEYGYRTTLPSNYSSVTERKIKKGLFFSSSKITKIDHIWTFHLVGILDGYIKKIYPVNYLNKSHINDLATNKLITNYGVTQSITENILKWTLHREEFDKLKDNEQIKKISIITSDLAFLKTEKAKIFNDKMELKKASC